jgi:ATP-dependent Lon protease
MGLKAADLQFSKGAIGQIINGYAREAGVRNLENQLKKIMRKVAVKIARGPEKKRAKTTVTEKNLKEYLGKPIFTSDRFYKINPVGVATGLAWTSMGGATLYIESVKYPAEKTDMKLTGQAGDVMKESAQIAWTYLQSRVLHYAPTIPFFEKSQVHIHIPEGATPKDGPSAGITMVTSLLSLLLEKPLLDNLGMTGELTLTGRVLPIGGLREKLIAARRSGLNVLIFPSENLRDYDELPDYLKKGIEVHFVDHYDEVFKIAFPNMRLHDERSASVAAKKTHRARAS